MLAVGLRPIEGIHKLHKSHTPQKPCMSDPHSRTSYFTTSSTHNEVKFMEQISSSFGGGGMTCSPSDKEPKEFFQYLCCLSTTCLNLWIVILHPVVALKLLYLLNLWILALNLLTLLNLWIMIICLMVEWDLFYFIQWWHWTSPSSTSGSWSFIGVWHWTSSTCWSWTLVVWPSESMQ